MLVLATMLSLLLIVYHDIGAKNRLFCVKILPCLKSLTAESYWRVTFSSSTLLWLSLYKFFCCLFMSPPMHPHSDLKLSCFRYVNLWEKMFFCLSLDGVRAHRIWHSGHMGKNTHFLSRGENRKSDSLGSYGCRASWGVLPTGQGCHLPY